MDAKTLRRLADDGLFALPISELSTLIAWCWDWSEVSGDARFASVARALEPLQELIEEADERGGTSSALLERVDGQIRERLGDVVDADNPVDGSIAARSFREELWRILRDQ